MSTSQQKTEHPDLSHTASGVTGNTPLQCREKVGKRIWFSALFFGLIGQIAWVVENMYFSTFAQDIFRNSGRADLSYLVTTRMVILSALTATAVTIIAGGFCDRVGKRKPFIAIGYILWGITIALFACIPMKATGRGVFAIAALLVVFDCLMTVAGSTSNDAAFNAWVADNTTPHTRGRVNAALATLPVFAVVIVFIGLGSLYDPAADSNSRFFLTLGIIPTAAGILALFVLRDADGVKAVRETGLFRDLLYGFRPAAIRRSPTLYLCLAAACMIGIAQQTFFSYLINFLSITLGLGAGFVLPMAVIILASAAFTGITGVLGDRYGRSKLYLPLLSCAVAGIFSFWLLQFSSGFIRNALLYGGGTLMMGGLLSLTACFTSTFQDHIPAGYEGRYQGVRMCFTVLIPMIIGPVLSLILGLDAMGMNGDSFVPPYSLFAAASVVALFTMIPILCILKQREPMHPSHQQDGSRHL